NITPAMRDARWSPCGAVVSDNALSERIGNTHGIKLSTRPPRSASDTATPNVSVDVDPIAVVSSDASSNAGFGPAVIAPTKGRLTATALARASPLAKPSAAATTPSSADNPPASRCETGSVNAYAPSRVRASDCGADGSI